MGKLKHLGLRKSRHDTDAHKVQRPSHENKITLVCWWVVNSRRPPLLADKQVRNSHQFEALNRQAARDSAKHRQAKRAIASEKSAEL